MHGAWTFKQAPGRVTSDPLVSGTTVVTDTYASPQTSADQSLGRVIALQLGHRKNLMVKSFPRHWKSTAFGKASLSSLSSACTTPTTPYPGSGLITCLLGLSLKTGAVVWQVNDPQDTQEYESSGDRRWRPSLTCRTTRASPCWTRPPARCSINSRYRVQPVCELTPSGRIFTLWRTRSAANPCSHSMPIRERVVFYGIVFSDGQLLEVSRSATAVWSTNPDRNYDAQPNRQVRRDGRLSCCRMRPAGMSRDVENLLPEPTY